MATHAGPLVAAIPKPIWPDRRACRLTAGDPEELHAFAA